MGAGLRRDAHRVGLREQVELTRRLSQRISEGDGIAIIVRVGDADAARAAQAEGAKALAVDRAIEGLRGLTSLPVLWLAGAVPVDADAVAIRPDDQDGSPNGLETVMEVRDEEELEAALEEHDPEIFLISPVVRRRDRPAGARARAPARRPRREARHRRRRRRRPRRGAAARTRRVRRRARRCGKRRLPRGRVAARRLAARDLRGPSLYHGRGVKALSHRPGSSRPSRCSRQAAVAARRSRPPRRRSRRRRSRPARTPPAGMRSRTGSAPTSTARAGSPTRSPRRSAGSRTTSTRSARTRAISRASSGRTPTPRTSRASCT